MTFPSYSIFSFIPSHSILLIPGLIDKGEDGERECLKCLKCTKVPKVENQTKEFCEKAEDSFIMKKESFMTIFRAERSGL